ncbi:MAG: glycosyltransferase family 2 protein [Tidjanibacter sp.]|nr:glycosyltransferase family 2 protein [Tidjanibacter sp.]
MKRIAAVTMVRNDEFYLRKWVEYYGKELGKENLYIFFDGTDQRVPDFCEGTTARLRERTPQHVVKAEKDRLGFLSEQAAILMREKGYDLVIGTDADEFLVVDPAVSTSLAEYLSGLKICTSVSALGIDVGQHLDTEGVIDGSRPFLEQRHNAYICSRYTKPSVIARPVRWGSGFHRIKGHNFHIDKNLFLFHFGSVDLKMIEDRMGNMDLVSTGRLKHIQKRAKTIFLITGAESKEWDKTTRRVRRIHQYMRPIWAINKPWNTIRKFVVRIPERFSKIV